MTAGTEGFPLPLKTPHAPTWGVLLFPLSQGFSATP